MVGEADLWAEKSERLYLLLHKSNLETLRKNPFLSGYHWWLFQDYWTSSNGIVDHYFRPKSIAKEEVVAFNSAVVLLQDGLDRTYRGKTQLDVRLLLSNFSEAALNGKLDWKVTIGNRVIAEKQLPSIMTPQGAVAEVARLGLELPDVAQPTKVKVTARLTAGKDSFANAWTTWLYPAVIRPQTQSVPVFSEIDLPKDWGVRPIPVKGELTSQAVYVTRWPCDPRVLDAMNRGAGRRCP